MKKLWQPGQIGPMKTKNRAVRSATNEHLASLDGVLSDAWSDVYRELAEGGVGTIITGHFAVDGTQRADEGQPAIYSDMAGLEQSCAVLRRTCSVVHRYGARLIVQISHSGPKAAEGVNGVPAKRPADLTKGDMERLVKHFCFAAKTCQECGADGVQIHMAHAYLLSSFLRDKWNKREDEYGGSLENRYRLCGEIIRAVRQTCGPGFAIMAKVDEDGCGDLHALLALCEKDGVDCVEVSGLDCAAFPGKRTAFYLDSVVKAKQGIGMPVSLVGGIFSLEEAERVLESGVEFVSFARSLIHDPRFIGKLERGEVTESPCLACGGCYKVYRQRPVRCVLHERPIPHLEQIFGPYEK